MSKATHLKWSWVYGGPNVEEFDSLEDAVEAAQAASGAGSESFWLIEEIGKGVVDPDLVDQMRDAISERDHQEFASQPPATHAIELRAPEKSGGRECWARIKVVYDGDPEPALAAARECYGSDRVRVHAFRVAR